MRQYKAWPNIQTKLPHPLNFIPLLLINPLCSNCFSSLTYIIADCCHRANSLSYRVGINIFYWGVKAFGRLSFVLFQFHGENIVKLSRSCPISSERTKMPLAKHCHGVRERGSSVYAMALLWCIIVHSWPLQFAGHFSTINDETRCQALGNILWWM